MSHLQQKSYELSPNENFRCPKIAVCRVQILVIWPWIGHKTSESEKVRVTEPLSYISTVSSCESELDLADCNRAGLQAGGMYWYQVQSSLYAPLTRSIWPIQIIKKINIKNKTKTQYYRPCCTEARKFLLQGVCQQCWKSAPNRCNQNQRNRSCLWLVCCSGQELMSIPSVVGVCLLAREKRPLLKLNIEITAQIFLDPVSSDVGNVL